MNPVDLAYIAAFLDGEGSIIPRKGRRAWTITMSQIDRPVLAWIQSTLGCGSITTARNAGRWLARPKAQYPDVYRFHLFGWQAAVVLRMLLPYMRVKRRIADEMLLGYPERPVPPPTIGEERATYSIAVAG